MRIGLDVRYISHAITGGVRTYVYHLARELPRVAPQHEFYFYADEKAPFELKDLPSNVVLRVMPYRGMISSIVNDTVLGKWMERDRVDLVHAPGNYGPKVRVPLIVTVHDALNLFPMSQHLRGFGRRPRQVALMMYLGRMTRASLERADHIITVSEHAKQDIANRGSISLDRISVTHEAAGDEFGMIKDPQVLEDVRRRFGLNGRIVLADGIKNPAAVLEAHARLPETVRRSIELVFFSREAGPRPPVAEALAQPGIKFISRPSTSDLVAMMNLATVFVFPSWYEGFGLPLVEAMSCGAPIVASSRGSIPEIVGNAGLIFDLETPAPFTQHLEKLLTNEAVRLEFHANALKRAGQFSWKRMAQATLRLYNEIALPLGRTA